PCALGVDATLRVMTKRAWIIAAGLVLAACGPSAEHAKVTGTPASPATDGTVDVTPKADFGDADLSIDLTHVTPAERISPAAHVFVVWARRGEIYTRLGKLKYDQQSREAQFEGGLVSGPFDLVITAEPREDVIMPGPYVLLQRTMHGSS